MKSSLVDAGKSPAATPKCVFPTNVGCYGISQVCEQSGRQSGLWVVRHSARRLAPVRLRLEEIASTINLVAVPISH